MNAQNMFRYIMYCRKSTDSEDRQVQSIEDQQKALKPIIDQQHIQIVKTFEESRSAKNPGRPDFAAMLAMIKAGEADGIMCWKLNRLARNPVDGGEIQWLLQQNILKSIITISREYLPTDNVLMMAVELGMANQFVLDLSADVKRGMQSKVEMGWKPGRAPIGYLCDKFGEKGRKQIYVDPERFPIVRRMWEHLLSGHYPIQRLWELGTEWGLTNVDDGRPLGKSGTYSMFTNMFYAGMFKYNDVIYQGKHKPMITLDEFDRAQFLLKAKGKPRPKHKRFAFTGIIECAECGGMITCDEKFKFSVQQKIWKRYSYYRCSRNKRDKECHQKTISEQNLVNQVQDCLDKLTIPSYFVEWGTEILRREHRIEQHKRDELIRNIERKYHACVNKVDNLIKLYISPENADRGLLNDDEFKNQKNILIAEKASIEQQQTNMQERFNDWLELTEKTFLFATHAKAIFDAGDYQKKHDILQAIGQKFTLKDSVLTSSLKGSFLTLKQGLENAQLKKAMREPSELLTNKQKNDQKEVIFSIWSSVVLDVRKAVIENDAEMRFLLLMDELKTVTK